MLEVKTYTPAIISKEEAENEDKALAKIAQEFEDILRSYEFLRFVKNKTVYDFAKSLKEKGNKDK